MKNTFQQALSENAPSNPQCKFNPVDHLAYLLYNLNPAHERAKTNLYDIPFVQKALESGIRAPYPTFWLWSEEEAAKVIEKCAQGFFVRKLEEVAEMRSFWKIVNQEKFSYRNE